MEAAPAYLPDDVVVEILARLPAKSLCRFKCVSRTWRHLISDPANCPALAQTLSGVFYYRGHTPNRPTGFAALRAPPPPGVVDSSLSLPPSCADMELKLLDSCNGLLLLRSKAGFFVVCNPATGDSVTLPKPSYTLWMTICDTFVAALGFDPSTSPHFYVFQLVQKGYRFIGSVLAVYIYSSETGKWIWRESGWSKENRIAYECQLTYLNGFLHCALFYDDAVASVDTKGQTWRVTHVRQRDEDDNDDCGDGFVGHSQGRLLYVALKPHNGDSISIYVLEDDHDSCWEWTFKHSVSKLDLIAPTNAPRQLRFFGVVALHPDGDLIYFYHLSKTLISYDMTRGVVCVICTLGEVSHPHKPFLPYVPFYSGPLASSSAD